jgi:hypothetical protein
MKAMAIVYGGILAMLIIASFAITYVVASGGLKRSIVSSEGKMVTFENEVELLLKNFDQGVEFISARSAYEIGKKGGFYSSSEVPWSYYYPLLDVLEKNLDDKIKDNLPSAKLVGSPTAASVTSMNITITGNRVITWGDADINTDGCQPLSSSRCFSVKGSKNISVTDEATASMIYVDRKIDSAISSSYFKLLWVGRQILEDPIYNSSLNDINNLKTLLETDFPDLDFKITSDRSFWKMGDCNLEGSIDSADISCVVAHRSGPPPGPLGYSPDADFNEDGKVDDNDTAIINANSGKTTSLFDVTIKDICSPPDTYCLAPLKPGETGISWFDEKTFTWKQIPYDYNTLIFKINTVQTGFTAPQFNFDIQLKPQSGSLKSRDSLSSLIRLNNIGSGIDTVDLSATSPDPTISVIFTRNSLIPTNFSVMKISTTGMTMAETYTITITGKGQNTGLTKSADFELTVNPSMFFRLSVNPANDAVLQNDKIIPTVFVKLVGGTPLLVHLSAKAKNAAGSDGGITFEFDDNDKNPPYQSNMKVTTLATTPTGDYDITVTGIGGGSKETTTYKLTVSPPLQFHLELSKSSDKIIPGSSNSTTVSVIKDIGLVLAPVLLSAGVNPNPMCGANPCITASITGDNNKDPDYSTTLNITTKSDTPDGDYAIGVTGTGGGWTAGITFTLTTKKPACNNNDDCTNFGKDVISGHSCSSNCTGVETQQGKDICHDEGTVDAYCECPDLPITYEPGNACGTRTKTCDPKCENGIEYREGSTESCNIKCDNGGQCPVDGTCTPAANCTYSKSLDCRMGDCSSTDPTRCENGYFCKSSATGSSIGCWGGTNTFECNPTTWCAVDAQCINENQKNAGYVPYCPYTHCEGVGIGCCVPFGNHIDNCYSTGCESLSDACTYSCTDIDGACRSSEYCESIGGSCSSTPDCIDYCCCII